MLVAAAVVVAGLVTGCSALTRSDAPVVISPTKSGKPWFSISSDGTGTLHGWDVDTGGSGAEGDFRPEEAFAFFDVGAVDLVDGVRVVHTTSVYVTYDTEVLLGSQPRDASSVFTDQGPRVEALGDRLLTIDFHRAGDSIVADRIAAPAQTVQSPIAP